MAVILDRGPQAGTRVRYTVNARAVYRVIKSDIKIRKRFHICDLISNYI